MREFLVSINYIVAAENENEAYERVRIDLGAPLLTQGLCDIKEIVNGKIKETTSKA